MTVGTMCVAFLAWFTEVCASRRKHENWKAVANITPVKQSDLRTPIIYRRQLHSGRIMTRVVRSRDRLYYQQLLHVLEIVLLWICLSKCLIYVWGPFKKSTSCQNGASSHKRQFLIEVFTSRSKKKKLNPDCLSEKLLTMCKRSVVFIGSFWEVARLK